MGYKAKLWMQICRFVGYFIVVYYVTIVAWVKEENFASGNWLHSTHRREFHYMKLCRPAYFDRTTQFLPQPGY